MRKPAPPARPDRRERLKGLDALETIRPRLPQPRERPGTGSPETESFREAMRDVTPLPHRHAPRHAAVRLPKPDALQRARDDQAALDESMSGDIGIETLLDTDEALSYRRAGIGPDTLKKLRRGFWVVQAELDLHGHRVDEARHALAEFLKRSVHRGLRCVRIVHGKGLGSRAGIPVLKGKVKLWLTRHQEVIAFCQARPADGGAGALIVLLKPTAAPR